MLATRCSDLTTILVHFIALIRSSLLSGSVLYNFVTLPLPEVQKKLSEMNVTAGCITGANVYTSDFFSETSFETELNHRW